MAIFVLGKCGYTPKQVKFETPIHEINQIMHAHAVSNGAILDWQSYNDDEGLMESFEKIKTRWEHDRNNC